MDTLFYFEYHAEFYDEMYEKMKRATGIVAGYTMKDAFDRIMNYYGEDNIEEIHLYSNEAEDVWELVEYDNNENETIKLN